MFEHWSADVKKKHQSH